MANHDSLLRERLGIDYDLSPLWTSCNMVMAGEVLLMANHKATYQRQSWIPNAPTVVTTLKCPYTFTKGRKTQQRVKPVYFKMSEPCGVDASTTLVHSQIESQLIDGL